MSLITGVDFATIPTRDLDRSMAFYGETLGLHCSVRFEGRPFAEYETGNLTLGIIEAEKMGIPYAINPNPLALHVADVQAARGELEGRASRSTARSSTPASAIWRSSPTPTATG